MQPRICVYGTVVVDRIRQISRLPQPGEYCEFSVEELFPGGEAANTAAALANWGEAAVLCGNSIGDSSESKWLADRLSALGVQVDHLDPKPGPAPTCDIYVDASGERTMFGRGWDHVSPLWPGTPMEYVALDPNHGAAAREAAVRAHKSGSKLYFLDFLKESEPIPAGSFWQSSTDWIGEAGNAALNRERATQISSEYDCVAVLTDGGNAIHVAERGIANTYPAYQCPNFVDATGAGDVFRAGMLFGLVRGWELSRCLSFASAAGCLNCMASGATGNLPTLGEIENLQAEQDSVHQRYLHPVTG